MQLTSNMQIMSKAHKCFYLLRIQSVSVLLFQKVHFTLMLWQMLLSPAT